MTYDLPSQRELIQFYKITRAQTEALCQPLSIEDYVVQSLPDVSPPKWHLAHTSWFFETFLLKPQKNYSMFHQHFEKLFNSYYQKIGEPFPRNKRGMLSRPTVEMIYQYRKHVDEHVLQLLDQLTEESFQHLASIVMLGIHHEQQHQELLLMDIKHNFAMHLDFPIYHSLPEIEQKHGASVSDFLLIEGGLTTVGYQDNKFCFDNELPSHHQLIKPFLIATQLVTNGEYLEFINAGGYDLPEYWLADGWDTILSNKWKAPLYWFKTDNRWYTYTLNGLKEIILHEPVVHVSYYEADAFARWRLARLPTESEWEHVIAKHHYAVEGNFLENNFFQPGIGIKNAAQFFGDVWEWTMSAYAPYPGYKPINGVFSEYNGKFMSNQMVLKGGSCVTPLRHIRSSYRNFYQPEKRWQFSGIRLAKDL